MENMRMTYIPGYIFLRISGNDLDLNEISKGIGITPTYSYKNGEKRIIKNQNKSQEVVYSEDCWIKQYKIPRQTELNKALQHFLNKIRPRTEYLHALTKHARITLWISLYPEDIQININLPNEMIGFIGGMGIEMDISMYCLQDFYSGEYMNANPNQ
jgi:hypothetical protein